MKFITRCSTLAFLFLNLAIASADIQTGLVSYWPFETTDGVTTPDLAFGNNLTLNNGPTLVPGQRGNAFSFNGAVPPQYLGTTHSTNNQVSGLPIFKAGPYTIMMWVKGQAQTAKYLFTEASTTSGNPLLLLQSGQVAANNSKFDVLLRNDANTALLNHRVSGAVVFDDTWHHIAWVDNNGVAGLYVDGVLDATNFNYTNVGSFSFTTTTVGALVRSAVSANSFIGSIDEVALWERVLTQSEIQQVMTNGIATPIPPAAPTVVQQPVSSTNQMGDRATFSVYAVGNRPLSYQWFKGLVPITGATNTTLVLTDLTISGTNNYHVEVANPFGTNSSDTVTLVILPDSPSNIPSGLLSYWPFNTVDANTNSPDLYSQHDMQLNFMDASNLVPGQIGNALSFNGTNQYGNRLGGFPVFNNTNYSVSLWVNGAGTGQTNRQVFAEGNSTNNTPFFFIGTDNLGVSGLVDVKVSTGLSDRKSTRTAFDGTWHHLVWVDENGKGKLYVDGVLDETDYTYTRSPLVLNTTSVAALLRTSAANFFAGNIDEVAVWNRRLTFTEIQAIKNQGIPAPVSAIPPSITVQPVSRTNSIFAGDSITFSVQATGTS
ncbi:MAG: LamG-like jellyroll fold domain-containing protein, partial [Limisphaerales bacterium]